MKTIADWWKSYDTEVVPKDAGQVQRGETQLAFFAGAHAALCALRQLAVAEVPEDAACNALEALWQETQAFGETVGAEVAFYEGRAPHA